VGVQYLPHFKVGAGYAYPSFVLKLRLWRVVSLDETKRSNVRTRVVDERRRHVDAPVIRVEADHVTQAPTPTCRQPAQLGDVVRVFVADECRGPATPPQSTAVVDQCLSASLVAAGD